MTTEHPTGIEVTPDLVLPAEELSWRFSPSGGPGGQHANTSNTRAEVTFDVTASAVLSARQRQRLLDALGPSVVIRVDDTRSQARNREIAVRRLVERLQSALHEQPRRVPTRPGAGAKARRVEDKRRRGRTKAERSRRHYDD